MVCLPQLRSHSRFPIPSRFPSWCGEQRGYCVTFYTSQAETPNGEPDPEDYFTLDVSYLPLKFAFYVIPIRGCFSFLFQLLIHIWSIRVYVTRNIHASLQEMTKNPPLPPAVDEAGLVVSRRSRQYLDHLHPTGGRVDVSQVCPMQLNDAIVTNPSHVALLTGMFCAMLSPIHSSIF